MAASCDLLLSCLPQVHLPGRKLAEVLQQLLQQQSAAAVLLLERLTSGDHPELAAAAGRSAELDASVAALAGSGGWLAGADVVAQQALALLLVGNGSASLLSEAAQVALLGHLLQLLLAAAQQASGGPDEAAPAAAPVLGLLQSTLLSPALDASASAEVQSLRLQLLASALALLLHDVAADAEAATADPDSGSDRDPSTFQDESEEESVEVQEQLGLAAAAARQLWQQHAAIAGLVSRATAQQQAAFVGSLQEAIEGTLEQHATPEAAAAAAAEAGQLLLPALGGGSTLQQLLRALLQPQAETAASTSSTSSRYGPALALFLAATGAVAGFAALLPPGSPDTAMAAVDILAALEGVGSAAAEHQHRLQHYLAATAAFALLQPVLAAAAAAADASPSHAAVLLALLREASSSGGSIALEALAAWFAAAAASQQSQLGLPLLLEVLTVVAPALRASDALLQQSHLAELSQRLCQQCCVQEPAAVALGEAQEAALQLLQAAVACFPCATGAEAAAQLPSPAAAAASAQQQPPASSHSFSKGDAVWYRQQDGSWVEAEVQAVDVTVQPPSYSIQFSSGSHRETEAARLRPRQAGEPAPASEAQLAAAATAAASAAAERRAAAGAAMALAGCCTPEEQAALLQLLQHQVRGVRAAAAAARAEAGCAPDPTPGVAAAVAALLHSSVAFCGQQLTQQHWALLLEQLRAALAQCTVRLAAAAARVSAAVSAAAGEIAVGADMSSPAVAIQFFRRLGLKGVLQRSAKVCWLYCGAEMNRPGAQAPHQLVDRLPLPTVCPCLPRLRPGPGASRPAGGCAVARAGSPGCTAAAAAAARPAGLHAGCGGGGRQPQRVSAGLAGRRGCGVRRLPAAVCDGGRLGRGRGSGRRAVGSCAVWLDGWARGGGPAPAAAGGGVAAAEPACGGHVACCRPSIPAGGGGSCQCRHGCHR